MDLKDLEILRNRIDQYSTTELLEESTKTAFILPFLQVLGYDIFNPSEIIPEYTCDFGIKKGEKIDYAIMKNGNPIILIETKKHKSRLNIHGSQLFRYFATSKARIGILTNGIEYEIYSDLENGNIMDETPFFKFNILTLNEEELMDVKKLSKSAFSIDDMISSAENLKYSNKLFEALKKELSNPSDEFLKLMINSFHESRITPKILEKFKSIFKRTMDMYINDIITKRLNLDTRSSVEPVEESFTEPIIDTTFQEIEGYSMIKTLLSDVIDPERITYRDSQSYMAVLLDDNNRKPICRLYFNTENKYVAFLEEGTGRKKEVKIKIDSLNDILNLKDNLVKSLSSYEEINSGVE